MWVGTSQLINVIERQTLLKKVLYWGQTHHDGVLPPKYPSIPSLSSDIDEQ